ncbi:hypothetical protein SAMN06264365_107192 [Actinoplanes regularis]|uniref:Uncharacterized protein n=1 Tax=Actinoplanes regularis TaxID=52697 RepID=A0A239AB19_9ACTN|nr:hypothetical protein SAMN06264365_107192 [Actinoplanes regularis]
MIDCTGRQPPEPRRGLAGEGQESVTMEAQ